MLFAIFSESNPDFSGDCHFDWVDSKWISSFFDMAIYCSPAGPGRGDGRRGPGRFSGCSGAMVIVGELFVLLRFLTLILIISKIDLMDVHGFLVLMDWYGFSGGVACGSKSILKPWYLSGTLWSHQRPKQKSARNIGITIHLGYIF